MIIIPAGFQRRAGGLVQVLFSAGGQARQMRMILICHFGARAERARRPPC